MTLRRAFALSLGICAVALVVSLIIGESLPEIVPTHWNATGQIDGRGPKAIALYLMPGMMVGMSLLMLVLPSLSPKKFEISTFIDAYCKVWLVVITLFCGIHLLVLQGARNIGLDMSKWMPAIIFVFFALIGNWMGKVRRNFFMGIRTPWTLANEQVWDRTHRVAGQVWFFGGLAGAILSVLGTPFILGMVLLLGMAFYPVVMSYVFYRRIEG